MDLFMTETAALADMVLPSTYFLEQQSLYSYVGRPLIILFNKAIEPPEDCWPEWKFWFELAKRMGYEKELPWKDIDEAQNEILSKDPFYTDLDTLRKNPGGYYFSKRRWKKYETEGLKTPSGKVELYSETLEKIGQPPLPTYVEPAESPISKPDIAKRYPLILITGLRSLYYDHSMHRSTPSLRAKDPQPMAEINTDTARKLGINSGDMVIIESPRGAIQMKAAVTSDIHSQVVSVPHGWGGLANQNILTDDIHDPVIGSSTMRALLCRVRKGELTQAPKVVLG
jgi:anaerobic selenocysteine-containing dehydrogenase